MVFALLINKSPLWILYCGLYNSSFIIVLHSSSLKSPHVTALILIIPFSCSAGTFSLHLKLFPASIIFRTSPNLTVSHFPSSLFSQWFSTACLYVLSCCCAVRRRSSALSSSAKRDSMRVTMACWVASGGTAISDFRRYLKCLAYPLSGNFTQ